MTCYIAEPNKWKMIHIPLTPYFLARDPDNKLWYIVEKELNHNDGLFISNDSYRYRFL